MKNLFVATLFVLSFAFFQNDIQAQTAVGGGATFSTDIGELGFGIRAQIDMTDIGEGELNAAPNIIYYPIQTGFHWFEGNLDAQYHLGEEGVIVGYPIIGLRYDYLINNNVFGAGTQGTFGLNTGLGTQYSIGDNLNIYLEGKYLFGLFNRFNFGLGITTNIGGN